MMQLEWMALMADRHLSSCETTKCILHNLSWGRLTEPRTDTGHLPSAQHLMANVQLIFAIVFSTTY